jgi:ATP diphosphatase
VLDGVPTGAPSLQRAERLTEKASRIGFDWPDIKGVREKLSEELAELDQAIAKGDKLEIDHELGDVLFSLANLARFLNTPAEDSLRLANKRFVSRFSHLERKLDEKGIKFQKVPLEDLNALWDEAKALEKSGSGA